MGKNMRYSFIQYFFMMVNINQLKKNFGESKEKNMGVSDEDAYTSIYRIDSLGNAYLYEQATFSWEKKLANVRAIVGGAKDLLGRRLYNSFYIDNNGTIYEETLNNVWTRVTGIIDAIDISSNGKQTYAVCSEGYLYKYCNNENESLSCFNWYAELDNQTIKKVDVDSDGIPWVTAENNEVYMYNNNSWNLV